MHGRKNNIKQYTIMKINFKLMLPFMVILMSACSKESNTQFTQSVYLISPTRVADEVEKKYSGITEGDADISLAFKTPGELNKIYVKEGDYVRKGELLAELDDSDYKLGVEALEIQYSQVKDEVSRIEKLYQQKSVSVNDYEKAQAGLKQLAIQLQLNKNKLNYTKLYAPTDGYIVSVNFSKAEMVDAGTTIFKLLDMSKMEIIVDFPVSEYQQKQNIKEAYCKVSGIEDVIPLKLLSVTPKADGNQMYRAKFSILKPNIKHLTAGMNVEVSIISANDKDEEIYTLPLSAVFKSGEESYVWVFNTDSTLTKKEVEIDEKINSGAVVVKEGLNGEEKVVRTGVSRLQEGQKVQPIENSSKTNVGGLL